MATNEAPNGNLGDWSELYTLAYLLVNGGAYGADENQNRREDLYYKVLQVLIAESDLDPFLKYEIKDNKIIIHAENEPVVSILRSHVEIQLSKFFSELTQGGHSRHFQLESGEVLLSAGSIGSVQILERSGIGAASHLLALGIPVIADLPGVGENLQR